MYVKQIVLPALSAILLFSCVSSKKFKKSQADYATLQTQYTRRRATLAPAMMKKQPCRVKKPRWKQILPILTSKLIF